MVSILLLMKAHKKEVMISVIAYIIYCLQHPSFPSIAHKEKCKKKSKQVFFSTISFYLSTGNAQLHET